MTISEDELQLELFKMAEDREVGQVLNLETNLTEYFLSKKVLETIRNNPNKYEIISLPKEEFMVE